MQVPKINSYYRLESLKLHNSEKVENRNGVYTIQTPVTDSVNFSKRPVLENLIIEDLSVVNHWNDFILSKHSKFSKKLKKTISDIRVINNKTVGNNVYKIMNDGIGLITIEIPDSVKDIKPGLFIGKAGFFATLDVKNPEGEDYKIIVPEDAELHIPQKGIHIKNTKNKLAFKGSTCTVNEFFKPQNTTKSVKGFIKMIRNAEIFKTIEKSKKDYSEKFHPYILAGGFGTRLEVISHAKSDNKPSTVTPIPGWKLIHFSLLNLYQANLLNEKTKIDFEAQREANSAVGCVVTTLGYKISTVNGQLDLIKSGKSIVPENKNLIIMPSDNITDINLSEALDSYLARDDAGMMVVGVPDHRCYGGLILHNEKNDIEKFITKPTKELLDTGLGRIMQKDEKGNETVLRNVNGLPTSLGNAFIYIINPDILDTIADIYRNKIRTAYGELIAEKGANHKLTKEEYLDVIECLWDREIIPALVEKSNNGELKNKDGKDLKVITHKALASWNDVGEYPSYCETLKNVARDDCYQNMPQSIKEAIKDNIKDGVIFNADVKEHFQNLIGSGYTKGNIVVLGKGKEEI